MFRKLIKNLRTSIAETAGFTMIELLVVISVIGVLAVAVLSSINPIEQINKGRDTRTRSDAAQLINAIDRYVAIHEEYPWNTNDATIDFDDAYSFSSEVNGAAGIWPTVDPDPLNNSDPEDWPNLLVSTSEVKDGFISRQIDEDVLYVLKPSGYDANTIVCFAPASNAFRQEAAETCGDYTVLPGLSTEGGEICPDPGNVTASGVSQNFICLP